MADDQGTVRVFCTNDGCEFKDMRIEGDSSRLPKCPECGEHMKFSAGVRSRRTSTF